MTGYPAVQDAVARHYRARISDALVVLRAFGASGASSETLPTGH